MEHMQMQDRIIQEMTINSPIRDRRIYLNDEIDRESIFKVIYWLDRLEMLDLKTGKKNDIEIIIDSYGGSVYHTLSLISKIESLIAKGYNIITTVHSVAMSGGFFTLICGSERRALRHSRIMAHGISSGCFGSHQSMEEDMEETQSLWIRLKDITKSKTKISDEKLEELKKFKYDWFMWAETALELGVIDKII